MGATAAVGGAAEGSRSAAGQGPAGGCAGRGGGVERASREEREREREAPQNGGNCEAVSRTPQQPTLSTATQVPVVCITQLASHSVCLPQHLCRWRTTLVVCDDGGSDPAAVRYRAGVSHRKGSKQIPSPEARRRRVGERLPGAESIRRNNQSRETFCPKHFFSTLHRVVGSPFGTHVKPKALHELGGFFGSGLGPHLIAVVGEISLG